MMRRPIFAACFTVASALSAAAAPGGIEITCDVPRVTFRTAAVGQGIANFRLWSAASGGSQLGSDYPVAMGSLAVIKRYTDKYDSVSTRRAARINAVIGSDASPVLLPANGQTYLEVQVGTSLFGCDFAATADPSIRRRLQSVPFAQESNHSDTCETCTTVATSGGAAEAWVNFDGPTGTIRGQHNVSSITRTSLGNFVINFTTPMANANYAAQLQTSWNGNANQGVYPLIVSQTTTSLTIVIFNGTSAYGPYDPPIVSVVIFG